MGFIDQMFDVTRKTVIITEAAGRSPEDSPKRCCRRARVALWTSRPMRSTRAQAADRSHGKGLEHPCVK